MSRLQHHNASCPPQRPIFRARVIIGGGRENHVDGPQLIRHILSKSKQLQKKKKRRKASIPDPKYLNLNSDVEWLTDGDAINLTETESDILRTASFHIGRSRLPCFHGIHHSDTLLIRTCGTRMVIATNWLWLINSPSDDSYVSVMSWASDWPWTSKRWAVWVKICRLTLKEKNQRISNLNQANSEEYSPWLEWIKCYLYRLVLIWTKPIEEPLSWRQQTTSALTSARTKGTSQANPTRPFFTASTEAGPHWKNPGKNHSLDVIFSFYPLFLLLLLLLLLLFYPFLSLFHFSVIF